MRKIIIALIAFLPFLFVGCNNELVNVKSNLEQENSNSNTVVVDSSLGFVVKIYDNTLCFDSAKDVITALNVLHEMPSAERRKWEASVGFTSAQTLLEDIQSKIEVMSDKNEFEKLVQENKELILEAPDNSYGIKSRIYGYYPCITGKNGLFVSESVWCKVFDGKFYSTNDFDREGYLRMCKLSDNKDLSDSNVQSITVDFNWEDNSLKSYHYDRIVTETFIEIYQYNTAGDYSTKRSRFDMQLINNYTTRRTSEINSYTQYYLDVYYNGGCSYCNPYSYRIIYAGKIYPFYYVSDRHYRIKLPYSTYLDDHPFTDYNWDNQAIWHELIITSIWYTYWGGVDLSCSFQAQKKNLLFQWVDWGGTVVWFNNVTADIELGKDVYYRSVAIDLNAGPYMGNYYELVESGFATGGGSVYSMPISLYQNDPLAKFKGCVSGTLGSRFCPETYNFNFSF